MSGASTGTGERRCSRLEFARRAARFGASFDGATTMNNGLVDALRRIMNFDILFVCVLYECRALGVDRVECAEMGPAYFVVYVGGASPASVRVMQRGLLELCPTWLRVEVLSK